MTERADRILIVGDLAFVVDAQGRVLSEFDDPVDAISWGQGRFPVRIFKGVKVKNFTMGGADTQSDFSFTTLSADFPQPDSGQGSHGQDNRDRVGG